MQTRSASRSPKTSRRQGSTSRPLSAAAPAVVSIPGGRFWMGSSGGRPDEAPVHEVQLSRFSIGRTPVTCAEYAPFLAETGAAPPPWWAEDAFAGPSQPVVGVTWFEATAFAEWLGRRHVGRWRLPTEAEWERAARGGAHDAPTAWGATLPQGEVPSGRI